jgi:hypothetical protein
MSLGNFIMDSILTGEIVWLVFEITLMIPLKDMSLKGSVWTLMILMLVCTTIGVLLTFKKRRTRVSIFVNAVSGAILYFLMAYWSTFRKELTIGLLIVGALVVAYASLVLVNYFRNRPVRVSFGACLRACLLSSRTIATIGVFVIVFSSAAAIFWVFLPLRARRRPSFRRTTCIPACGNWWRIT